MVMSGVTEWIIQVVFPIIKDRLFAVKIQKAWRFHTCRKNLSGSRNFVFLNSDDRVKMSLYTVMHDTRCLMCLTEEEKMRIPVITWILGIIQDARIYMALPTKVKEDDELGIMFAKTMLKYTYSWYREIPPAIFSQIEPNLIIET
jgi:hypothetical protein